jgi:tetratricopeptide (TPR) repeat protein
MTELEKAIRISPEFAAAHTNLAVQYLRMGRFEDSIAESARAIQLGGPDPVTLCNLATAQAGLHRYAKAEKSARTALRLDSGYLKANLILGSILADEPATRGEGVKHLEKAAAEFASERSSSSRFEHCAERRAELRQEASALAGAEAIGRAC